VEESMSGTSTKVGFIGLGRMGKAMAINVVNAGFALTVYDLRRETVRELTAMGAKAATSSRGVAEASDVIAIAVVNDAQTEAVCCGADGAIEGAPRGSIIAIHSTVLPGTIKKLARIAAPKGVAIVDVPVSGGEAGARQKALSYMVGGGAETLNRCREVFATSAAEIFHMGPLGSGAAAKMIVQVVTCLNMLAAREAEVLAGHAELDFAKVQGVLHASSGQSFVADHWLDRFKLEQDPIEVRRQRTRVFQQSLAPAIEMARQLGLSLAGASLAERLMPQIMGLDDS
jgi:3-hydroxyisobutyrate dehydrogenase-like beta-hydroxyacid dehydrogenase